MSGKQRVEKDPGETPDRRHGVRLLRPFSAFSSLHSPAPCVAPVGGIALRHVVLLADDPLDDQQENDQDQRQVAVPQGLVGAYDLTRRF